MYAVEFMPFSAQDKALHTNTEVAVEEVLEVDSAAPAVIDAEKRSSRHSFPVNAYTPERLRFNSLIRIPLRARRGRNGL